ncbi:MAG: hypothetical protein ACJAQ1_001677, partial [Flavobacterium sp.]
QWQKVLLRQLKKVLFYFSKWLLFDLLWVY